MKFSHEKLIVYQRSLKFIEFVNHISTFKKNNLNAFEQLDRASSSIPLNIAEGTGKYTGKDKCRYYDIARGSALESAACLDVLFKRKIISEVDVENGKQILVEIVSMLIGLIKNISERVYEESVEYRLGENDYKQIT